MIYIDGNHERETVLLDSIFCWPMLNVGGTLIWDDYQNYKVEADNWERPTSAVDGFAVAFSGEFEDLHVGNQRIVRKTVGTPERAFRAPRAKAGAAAAIAESIPAMAVAARTPGNLFKWLRGMPVRLKS